MLRRVVYAAAAIMLALVLYSIKQSAFPAAEAAVQRYFEALARRDLAGAAEQLAADTGLASSSSWSAMWAVLSDPRYQPPAGVRTGGWQHAPAAGGERVVAAQYELGGMTYSSLLKLRRQDGFWAITNGTGSVGVNLSNAIVNGQRLDAGKSLRLFPGRYELGTAPNAPLLAAPPVTVVVTPDRAETAELRVAFTANAVQAVKQRIDGMLTECERSAAQTPSGCPFRVDKVGVTQAKWTILSRPELVVEQPEPGIVVVRGTGPGSVHFTGMEPGGVPIDRVDAFSLDGKCVEIGERVSCTFTA